MELWSSGARRRRLDKGEGGYLELHNTMAQGFKAPLALMPQALKPQHPLLELKQPRASDGAGERGRGRASEGGGERGRGGGIGDLESGEDLMVARLDVWLGV